MLATYSKHGSYKVVAWSLGISRWTVDRHMENIRSKVGVRSSALAVAAFVKEQTWT